MRQPKRQCAAKRKDGRQCAAPVRPDRRHCTFHDPELETELAEGRRAGGVTRARPTTLPTDTKPLPLTTAGDVLKAMAEAYNLIRVGRLGVREGNALALIGGTLLRAVEARALETEIASLKDKVNELTTHRGRVRR